MDSLGGIVSISVVKFLRKGKKSLTVPHPEKVCWGSSKKKPLEF